MGVICIHYYTKDIPRTIEVRDVHMTRARSICAPPDRRWEWNAVGMEHFMHVPQSRSERGPKLIDFGFESCRPHDVPRASGSVMARRGCSSSSGWLLLLARAAATRGDSFSRRTHADFARKGKHYKPRRCHPSVAGLCLLVFLCGSLQAFSLLRGSVEHKISGVTAGVWAVVYFLLLGLFAFDWEGAHDGATLGQVSGWIWEWNVSYVEI